MEHFDIFFIATGTSISIKSVKMFVATVFLSFGSPSFPSLLGKLLDIMTFITIGRIAETKTHNRNIVI